MAVTQNATRANILIELKMKHAEILFTEPNLQHVYLFKIYKRKDFELVLMTFEQQAKVHLRTKRISTKKKRILSLIRTFP